MRSRILVDVDGVAADLMTRWLEIYNEMYDDGLMKEQITQWDLHKLVRPEVGERVYDILHRDDLYDLVLPIPNAAKTLERLRYAGHEIVFGTTNVYGMTDPKLRWLYKYGFIDALNLENVIVAYDKTLIRARVIIDDKPNTIARWADQRLGEAILFEQPWNRYEFRYHMSRVHKAANWDDVYRIIMERVK